MFYRFYLKKWRNVKKKKDLSLTQGLSSESPNLFSIYWIVYVRTTPSAILIIFWPWIAFYVVLQREANFAALIGCHTDFSSSGFNFFSSRTESSKQSLLEAATESQNFLRDLSISSQGSMLGTTTQKFLIKRLRVGASEPERHQSKEEVAASISFQISSHIKVGWWWWTSQFTFI